jgi:photosystem II stability/assembly factor-like uncharacterized protein
MHAARLLHTWLYAAPLLALLSTVIVARAQPQSWPAITGFGESSTHHLFVSIEDPTTLFRSNDSGHTWAELFVPGGGVLQWHVAPNDMIFGISDDGAYIVRSSDEGETWYSAHQVGQDTTLYSLIVTPSGTVLACDPFTGCMIRSTSNGKKWEQTVTNVEPGFFNGLALLGSDSSANVYAADPSGHLSLSTDDGATWHTSDVHAPQSDYFTRMITTPEGVVYLITAHVGIWKLTPGDSVLTEASNGLPSGNVLQPVVTPTGTMITAPVNYSSTDPYHAPYRTTDGGRSWRRAASGLTDTTMGALIATHLFGVWAGTSNGLLFHSTDDGSTWTNIKIVMAAPSTFDPATVVAVARTSKCVYFTATWGLGVYRSIDTAKSWTAVNTGLDVPFVWTIDVAPNDDLFVGTVTGAYRSTDNGDHWTEINTGFVRGTDEGDSLVTAFLFDRSSMLAATARGMYRSVDNGSQWELQYAPAADPRFPYLPTYTLTRDANGRIYAGGAGTFVARAANDSASWETLARVDSGTPGAVANFTVCMYPYDGALLAGTDLGLFRSPDDGLSWLRVGGGLDSAMVFGFFPPNRAVIYAQTSIGVYRSLDSGATWAFDSAHSVLGWDAFLATAFDSGTCTSGSIGPSSPGSASLLQRVSTAVRDRDAQAPVPLTISNAPNPFTPETAVSYCLNGDARVDLRVYSIVGREVAMLVHDRMTMGSHVVRWTPHDLPSGIYVCKITVTHGSGVPRVATLQMQYVR